MFHWEDDFLKDTAKLEKLYRSCLQDAAAGYQLSPNETAVLLFLCHYAPEQDTATDIAQSRGISKALVARSVDGLHRRGFLACERDESDRRVVHLRLCGEGAAAAAQLQKSCWEVARQLRQGISDEELLTVHRIMKKMQRNLDALLEQRERKVK